VSSQIYDDFGKAGYSLTDYNEKWMTPNGLGEMAVEDTRRFSGGRLHVRAVPFRTGSDVGVDDHRKYLAVSTRTFPVTRSAPTSPRYTSTPTAARSAFRGCSASSPPVRS
jgi:hypothetical protein